MEGQVVSLAVPPGEQLDDTSLKVFGAMFCRNGGIERRANNGTLLGEKTLQGIHSLDSLSPNHPQPLFFSSPTEREPGGLPNTMPGSIEKSRPFLDTRPPILTNLCVRRIFNETFDYGGRFFIGGDQNYQQLTKDLRKHIRINGETTVEPDFKCHHIRILYHLLGVDFRGDAYFFCDGDELLRDVMKDATLRIINTRSQRGASNSVNKLLKKLRDKPEVGAQIPEEWNGTLPGSLVHEEPPAIGGDALERKARGRVHAPKQRQSDYGGHHSPACRQGHSTSLPPRQCASAKEQAGPGRGDHG